jgi:hypothetical protein
MTSALTPQRRAFLRRLERADAGGDSAEARRLLIADGQVVQPNKQRTNAAINIARGNIFGVTPQQTGAAVDALARRMTPSAAGKAALQRAKSRKG